MKKYKCRWERERLKTIKDAYPAQDARRTAKAIDVIFEEGDLL